MKPWQVNVMIVAAVLLVAFFLPSDTAKPVITLGVFATSVWAYLDSKKLGIERYQKTWLTPSATPSGVFAVCFLLWIVAFPMYITFRYRIKHNLIPLKQPQAV